MFILIFVILVKDTYNLKPRIKYFSHIVVNSFSILFFFFTKYHDFLINTNLTRESKIGRDTKGEKPTKTHFYYGNF